MADPEVDRFGLEFVTSDACTERLPESPPPGACSSPPTAGRKFPSPATPAGVRDGGHRLGVVQQIGRGLFSGQAVEILDKPGPGLKGHQEIHLPLAGIPQVVEIDPISFLVLDQVLELQEVGTHEILETSAFSGHGRPVPQVELGGLLERANGPMVERGDAIAVVQPLQDIEPVGGGPVTDLQVFPEGVDRKETSCPFLQQHGQGFHAGQVPNVLQIAHMHASQNGNRLTGPVSLFPPAPPVPTSSNPLHSL
jgi:hypothetical protein